MADQLPADLAGILDHLAVEIIKLQVEQIALEAAVMRKTGLEPAAFEQELRACYRKAVTEYGKLTWEDVPEEYR